MSKNFILGTFKVDEDKATMEADIDKWIERRAACTSYQEVCKFHIDYFQHITNMSGIETERLNDDGKPYRAINFEQMYSMMLDVFQDKMDNIMTFRDKSYASLMTDTQASSVKVNWADQKEP